MKYLNQDRLGQASNVYGNYWYSLNCIRSATAALRLSCFFVSLIYKAVVFPVCNRNHI